ncbi:hypothetical protein [Salibacterium aidingense]
MGRRRAEDPLGKTILFTKLAEVVPMESAGVGRQRSYSGILRSPWLF